MKRIIKYRTVNIRKILLIILFLLMGSGISAHAENPVANSVNQQVVQVNPITQNKSILGQEIPEGVLRKAYYDNSSWKSKSPYVTEDSNGPLIELYETGELKGEVNLKNGKKNGIEKMYYQSGHLMNEKNYIDDKYDGIFKEFYESGELESEKHYKNGKQEGVGKIFYKNGKLSIEGECRGGKINGVVKSYYENGQLETEANYKDDIQQGISKEYYENGQVKYENSFKDGQEISSKEFVKEKS